MTTKMRLPVGRTGGRPVVKDFWFAPLDGHKHPSESDLTMTSRIYPPGMLGSWSWALTHAELNDLWLVVQLDTSSPEARARDISVTRASIWRTGQNRRGLNLTSTVVDDHMFVRPMK